MTKEFESGLNLKMSKSGNIFPNDNIKNFKSTIFEYLGFKFTLCITIFSNLIFVIISQNGKLGSFYLGEKDQEKDFLEEESEEFVINTKCLLGNRKDETNLFLSETLIRKIFQSSSEYIKKVLISTTIKFDEIVQCVNEDLEDLKIEKILASDKYRSFIELLVLKVIEILNS